MKKTIHTIGGIVALAILLAGAAFIGGRLLNGQGFIGGPSNGPITGPGNGGPGFQQRQASAEDMVQPAKELPQRPADVNGVFDHRENNRVFVGTGGSFTVVQPGGGANTSYDGTMVEVVVTSQTKIYRDVTSRQFNNGPAPEGRKVQQILELGSLDAIGQDSSITVWGRKTGDRFIAEILVYSPPAFSTSP